MRIRFFSPTDEAQTQAYSQLQRRIDAFWQEFARRPPRADAQLDGANSGRLLRELHPELALEIVADVKPGRQLGVVRALTSQREPLAEWVVQRAPALAGWGFGATRERCGLRQSLASVRAQVGRDLQRCEVRVGVGRGHLLELVVRSGDFALADDPEDLAATETLLQRVLGDSTWRSWIGSLHTTPGPRGGVLRMASDESDPFAALTALVDRVEQGVRGVQLGLDERPYHRFCEHAEWTLLEVEPKHDAGPFAAQDDLVLCSTMLPEMLKCFLQDAPFCSSRFSRNDEKFAFIKYAAQRGAAEQRMAERVQLEDALNRALVPAGLGCVVGAGLGLRHGYIDLALSDLTHTPELCARVLASTHVPGPAWLLFCDSRWAEEWLPLTDGAGPPPGVPA
jgi:hypothetical protein